jgi:hypothetical protein
LLGKPPAIGVRPGVLDRRGSSVRALMHGLADLGVVDPAQVSRGDRKAGVTELALD